MAGAVDSFLRKCMEKLIDLSKRNRFLNFKHGRATSVRIVDELPPEIWKILWMGGQSMRFLPKRAGEEPPLERETALIERHRDRNLQTDLPEEALDKTLLRLFQNSHAALEEHGYNTLYLALGLLEWYETKQDTEPLHAPLLLVPVTLERKTVAAPFVLKPYEDDPVVNPALVRKLQADFKIQIPGLPEELETFDPKVWMGQVAALIAADSRWKVLPDIALAMFSFAKFAMYRDIDEHREVFTGDGRMGAFGGAGAWPSPAAPAADSSKAPESQWLVMDADSSQQETIASAMTGTDLVVEGPPGTGKSQTITNFVAEFLGQGKSVLFVSEKMAALEVVYDRLKRAGLGDFCLELHSHKASKRKVVEELRRTLEAVRAKQPEDETALKRLAETRVKLQETMEALHGPVAPLGRSPYQALSLLASRAELPDAGTPVADAETWTADQLAAQTKRVQAFVDALGSVQPRKEHPWRGSDLTDAPYELTVKLKAVLEKLAAAVAPAQAACTALAAACGTAVPVDALGLQRLVHLGQLLSTTPKPDAALLERDVPAWTDLVEKGEKFRALRSRLREGYRDDILDASLNEALDAYRTVGQKWYRLFVGRWRAARNLLRSLAKPGYTAVGLGDLEAAVEAQRLRTVLQEPKGAAIFGSSWKGTESDWEGLRKLAGWLEAWRKHVAEGRVTDRAKQLAGEGMAAGPVQEAQKASMGLDAAWSEAQSSAALKPERLWDHAFDQSPFDAIAAGVKAMVDGFDRLAEWTRYMAALVDCEKAGTGPFLTNALKANTPVERLPEAFECQFLRSWLDGAVRRRPVLASFDGRAYDKVAAQFREFDAKQIEVARAKLVNKLVSGLPDLTWNASGESELGVLQHEVRKKRAHLPIRKLLAKTQHALRALKPCLLMSPLSVAMFLDPKLFKADVVIFDEASQISPEDAMGSVVRGRQLIVVGDSRQLPPTAFFQAEREGEVEEETAQATDLESVLDACAARGVPRRRLLWHYRSRHESLIAFSNRSFYDNSLVTFPSPAERLAVEFRHVPAAVYERGTGLNREEAKAVAKAVFEQLKREPDKSVGVGTFGIKQREAVQDALEELRREDPSLESRFDLDAEDYTFVKNLESIQGDERDVIFISVGYGRDEAGKVSMNFGPLNQEGGDRRLNVLVTRARHKVVVFSSIKGEDFDLSKTQSRGVALLKKYLEYAERGVSVLGETAAEKQEARGLVPSVAKALAAKGIPVAPRVGVSSFRVDLAVADADRYVVAVECDGESDVACKTARDRYRLRRQALEARGWTVHRVWSLDWWRQPVREVARIEEAVKAAKSRAEAEVAAAAVAPVAAKEPEAPATVEAKKPATKRGEAIPGVAPYVMKTLTLRGSPEEFYEIGARQIAKALVEVVKAEGPIHRLEATRRAALEWGVTKALKKVRDAAEDGIDAAVASGAVRLQDDFLWPSGMTVPPVRTRRGDDGKDIDFVALEEIAEAAALVLTKEFRLGRDSLCDQTLKVLGFDRPSPRAKERAGMGVIHLIEAGRVVEDGGLFKLKS